MYINYIVDKQNHIPYHYFIKILQQTKSAKRPVDAELEIGNIIKRRTNYVWFQIY